MKDTDFGGEVDEADSFVLAVAKAINGPHHPVPTTSRWTLSDLRDVLWSNLSEQERAMRSAEARAVIATVLQASNDRPVDDGLRTAPRGALEIVRKRDPGMHGLIYNLDRLANHLDAAACAEVLTDTRRIAQGDPQ